MLAKETIDKIAKALKLDAATLEAAIKDEKEVPVTVPDGEVYTETELTTLKNNEYDKGKLKGVEMEVKQAKEKLGLDFQGKTIDGLLSAAQKKAVEDAGINPDKRVSELTEKLKTVQQTATQLEERAKAAETTAAAVKLEGEVLKHMPATTLDAYDVLTLMKSNGYSFTNENGVTVVMKDGKKVEDKLANPLPVKDVLTEFATAKKLIADAGAGGAGDLKGRGAGGGGAAGGKYTKLSEIKADFEKEGKSLNGEEFNAAVTKARADFKEFDMSA